MTVSRSLFPLLTLVVLMAACDETGYELPPYAISGSQLPNLAAIPEGGVLMSWVEPDGSGHRLRFARHQAGNWSNPGTVSRGDDWFINWADFPSVRIVGEQFWVAHWLVKREGNAHAYDIAVSISLDAGHTWSEPQQPHLDNTPTEHGFVSIFPGEDTAGLIWLDGRETLKTPAGDQLVGMTLQSAIITRSGEISESLVDPLVCDCCQTDIAVSSHAPLLVYRDRSQDEIRDIRIAIYEDRKWQLGQTVASDEWQVSGCPVNGPAIDASGADVGVAWYTQGSGSPRVQFARSVDGGQSFGDAIVVDLDNPLGRVDIAMDDTGCAIVSWIGGGGTGTAELRLRYIGVDNQLSDIHPLTRISASRPTGFPRIARSEDVVFVAWTDVLDESTHVRTEEVPIACSALWPMSSSTGERIPTVVNP